MYWLALVGDNNFNLDDRVFGRSLDNHAVLGRQRLKLVNRLGVAPDASVIGRDVRDGVQIGPVVGDGAGTALVSGKMTTT